MEPSNRLIPPHLNAETYRMETSGTYTHAYLDFVRVHKDGHILVGCSELTGRYWNGGACILPNDQESDFQKTNFKRDINLASTTADGCFSGSSDKVILCEDTGAISIWSKSEDAWSTWKEDLSVAEHDGPALVIECLDSDRLYVSAGGDGNVKVWDIRDNMICLRNYNSAHSMQVNTIGVKPMSQKHFVTGSLDGFISVWDEHTNKPVYDVIENNCGVRCLLWIEENKLLFGDESGQLSLIDLRDSKSVIKLHEFPAPVHRIAFNPRSSNIAVCCDNQILSVFHIDGEKLNLVYERKAHQDCIRGLAWDESELNALHTVGWDGELKKHIINE
ncbi:unnamed protein product [Pieris macdunnoughi]|uniref:Uncharacterized protein n=1 Tax=Pieris macdunnoughi TaxID=345717 RepID=A0A821MVR5_9NEOP|nr:unnamed protein product [Pieris macdunnoughi]